MAQLVRAPPCHGGGRRFEPVPGRFSFIYTLKEIPIGVLAQLGEHLPYKQRVTGSSPVGPIRLYQAQSFILIWRNSSVGESTWFIPMVSGVQIPFPLLNEEQV